MVLKFIRHKDLKSIRSEVEMNLQQKPNIIYILADDLGYGDVSCLNERAAFQTPHLDALYTNGMAFTDAHATSAVCTPSRYSILTGRYNWRSRLKKGVLGGFSPALIEADRMTVAQYLQQQGYRTAAVGKWHLGMEFAKAPDFVEEEGFEQSKGVYYDQPISRSPVDYGFDYFFGISASLDMPPYAYIENDRFTQIPTRWTAGEGKGFFRKGLTAAGFEHETVLDVCTEKVCAKISEYKAEPFFIYYPLTAPHTPILPAERFRGKSGTNEYGDFVLACDDLVGRIMDTLRENGLHDNTIVIFTSDNGCSPQADYAELSRYGHNPSYIFRGHKADIYEGGHRIPLLLQWPHKIKPGQTCSDLVSLVDLFATVVDIIGVKQPEQFAEDSISQLPLWLGEHERYQRTSLVHQSVDGSLSLRRSDYKLIMCPGSGGWSWPQPGVVIDGAPDLQLYRLSDDIGETANLADEQTSVVDSMRAELAQIVQAGRSTPGMTCSNQGEAIWDSISWLNDA